MTSGGGSGLGEMPFLIGPEPTSLIHQLMKGRMLRAELTALAATYLAELEQIAPGNARVTDKMPANYVMVGLIHWLLPNARIIHCRRNAIDTCLSIWMTPNITSAGFRHDRKSLVSSYREYLRIMDHWRRVIPENRFLDVEYEDLVANREAVTRKMVSFCGLDWDDACLSHEKNERAVRTPSLWQARQPVYNTSVEKRKQFEPWLGEFATLADVPDFDSGRGGRRK